MSDDLLTTGATETGWVPARELSYEEWTQLGNTLQTIHRLTPMWLGDWLNYGERKYGETYTEALLFTDHSLESLKQYKWVMGAVPPAARRAGLTFTHYRIVARLPVAEQIAWLDQAARQQLGTKQLADKIAGKDRQMIDTTTTTIQPTPATTGLPPAPPAPRGQGVAPTPPPPMSAAERLARVWSAWLILHSTPDVAPVFPANVLDEVDRFFGQTIDGLLAGTGLESWEIYKRWDHNVAIHGL